MKIKCPLSYLGPAVDDVDLVECDGVHNLLPLLQLALRTLDKPENRKLGLYFGKLTKIFGAKVYSTTTNNIWNNQNHIHHQGKLVEKYFVKD